MAKPIAKLVALITPKRRWFQFRLLTLFVLVTAAAIPCVWLKSKMEYKRREREAVARIKTLFGVEYDWEVAGRTEPPGPVWMRKLLGEDCFTNVVGVHHILIARLPSGPTDTALEHIKHLNRVESLSLRYGGVTDASLRHLKDLGLLKKLNLMETRVSDAGLIELTALTRLELLYLVDTKVTDAGVGELQKSLPNCKIVH